MQKEEQSTDKLTKPGHFDPCPEIEWDMTF